MRRVLGALAVAVVFASGATVMAAGSKPCYLHSEDGIEYDAVWSNGVGHENHPFDIYLGDFATYDECLAAASI